jgi:hypothetical protein
MVVPIVAFSLQELLRAPLGCNQWQACSGSMRCPHFLNSPSMMQEGKNFIVTHTSASLRTGLGCNTLCSAHGRPAARALAHHWRWLSPCPSGLSQRLPTGSTCAYAHRSPLTYIIQPSEVWVTGLVLCFLLFTRIYGFFQSLDEKKRFKKEKHL